MQGIAFEKVWYRRTPSRWAIYLYWLAFQDVGRLTLTGAAMRFDGEFVTLAIERVLRASCEKQGSDFINHWVKVDYEDASGPCVAYFADGRYLGWSGIFGGTRVIYTTIARLQNALRISQRTAEAPDAGSPIA